MIKVSIIIPVYNVEKYLAKCMDTVTSQTLDEIEIICVNDGSTDSSLNILEHYAKFDSRIKIVNKENGGLSSARNAGIKVAEGKYILFVDSDDYISSIAAEKLYENAEHNNSDVVISDYISGGLDVASKKIINKLQFLEKYENTPVNISKLEFNGYKYVFPCAWAKLYRKDLIKDKILFYEGVIHEDVPFWAEVYLSAKRITYLPMGLYYYVTDRPESIMNTLSEKAFDILKIHEIVDNLFKKYGQYDKYKSELELIKVMDFVCNYFRIDSTLKENYYNKIKSLGIELDYDYYLNSNYMDIEKTYVKYFKLMNRLSYEDFKNVRLGEIK